MDFLRLFTNIAKDAERIIERADNTLIGKNLKGDTTRKFDLAAEDACFQGLAKVIPGFEMLGEEKGVRIKGKPEYMFVVDPCDGSYNRLRGIGTYCFSIAGMKYKETPTLRDIEFGFVKNFVTGDTYYAEKGKGALFNGKEAHASKTTDLADSLITIDLSIFNNPPSFEPMYSLFRKIKKLRCFGTSAYSTAAVSSGQAEAYVDLRDRLSIENYAASQLIVKEAGGILSDMKGNEINIPLDITKVTTLIVSCNKTIHEKILECLK